MPEVHMARSPANQHQTPPEYRTILLDPPWMERGGGKSKRGADRHYPLLHTREMPRVILQAPVWRPASDCILFMWATANHLPGALWLIESIGFRYVTNAVWVKPSVGLGQYFRMRHEHLLLATRGSGPKVRTAARDIGSVVEAPRQRHSQKPEASYAMIERRSEGPYLEMFARSRREGWDVWGDECTAGVAA